MSLSPEELERFELEEKVRVREEISHREIDERCASDGLWWLQNVTETYDEHATKKCVEAYKPFPIDQYMYWLWRALLLSERLLIPKSREMMTSWLVAGFITWFAQWHKRVSCVVQTQNEDKVKKLLTYSKCLYDRQPDWLRAMHPLTGGAIISSDNAQTKTAHSYLSGSEVIGIPGGVHQVRLYHPTIVVFDEAAHLVEFSKCYDTASPVAAKTICISSAAPGAFGDMCDDEAVDIDATEALRLKFEVA